MRTAAYEYEFYPHEAEDTQGAPIKTKEIGITYRYSDDGGPWTPGFARVPWGDVPDEDKITDAQIRVDLDSWLATNVAELATATFE